MSDGGGSPSAGLVVMSFNVRASLADAKHPWLCRRRAVRRLLRDVSPTLMGFQEVFAWRSHDLGSMLPTHRRFLGCGGGGRVLRTYNPVFWDAVSTRVVDRGAFWLGPTPGRWCRDDGARFARTVTWIVVEHRSSLLLFMNTHLDHVGSDCRAHAARILVRHVKERWDPKLPVIVVGDFNCMPGTTPYEILARGGFRDAWVESGRATDGGVGTVVGDPASRIDWVLFSGPLAVLQSRVLVDPVASDHFPLVACFA